MLTTTVLDKPTTHISDLWALTKPRVTSLVMVTTAGGALLAPGEVDLFKLMMTLFGTAAVVGSANTLNCYLERDVDGLMVRTADRPLPAGRLDPAVALAFGLLLGALSIPVLAMFANGISALLAAFALASYVLVYTPMKRLSPFALVVGAVPGALPPLIGWAAATGQASLPGLALFGILFLWQIPHFLAIALYRQKDYAAAGLKVMPVVRGATKARLHLAAYAALLLPVTWSLVPLGVAGRFYGAVAIVTGLAYFIQSLRGLRKEVPVRWARNVFWLSLIHLTLLFGALVLDGRT